MSALRLPGPARALLDAAAIGPLRQSPARTLLAVLAIALGVALGFSVYLINRVAADEVRLASRSLFGMADLAVQAPGLGFDEELYPQLAALEGIAVTPTPLHRSRLSTLSYREKLSITSWRISLTMTSSPSRPSC